MRPVEAVYENGLLRPAKPLNLRPGEKVALIVLRHSDPARWDLERLSASATDNLELVSMGLEDDLVAMDYKHVEAKQVGTLKVRYRNVGRLAPRSVPLEEEPDPNER